MVAKAIIREKLDEVEKKTHLFAARSIERSFDWARGKLEARKETGK